MHVAPVQRMQTMPLLKASAPSSVLREQQQQPAMASPCWLGCVLGRLVSIVLSMQRCILIDVHAWHHACSAAAAQGTSARAAGPALCTSPPAAHAKVACWQASCRFAMPLETSCSCLVLQTSLDVQCQLHSSACVPCVPRMASQCCQHAQQLVAHAGNMLANIAANKPA